MRLVDCADDVAALVNDGLVFCWGGGHSRMAVEEMFPRIGSFPGFYPMVELALTFYTQVVGADGLPQSFFLERQERYADAILVNYEFGPYDSMICFSSTGINGLVIEIGRKIRAPEAEERGVATYSALWGRRTATLAWWGAMLLSAMSSLLVAQAIGLVAILGPAFGVALALAAMTGWRFLVRPTRKRATLFEPVSGLWTLVTYLGLGVGPWVLPS